MKQHFWAVRLKPRTHQRPAENKNNFTPRPAQAKHDAHAVPISMTRRDAYLERSLEGLLYIQPLPHNRRVKLLLEGQQIHVGLRLGHQVSDSLGKDLVANFPFLLTEK